MDLRKLITVVVVILVILIALVLVARCFVGRVRTWIGGARTETGGAVRAVEVRDVLKVSPEKVLGMPWDVKDPGEFGIYEGNIEGGTVVAKSPQGPPHAGTLLVVNTPRLVHRRQTELSPWNLNFVSAVTFNHQFAYVLIVSEEGRYVLRADRKIPAEDIRKTIINSLEDQRMENAHKILRGNIVKVLSSIGFVLAADLHDDVRFARDTLYTTQELERKQKDLRELTESDIAALDWSDVNQTIRPLLSEPIEHSGDMEIVDGKVLVTKIRKGRIPSTWTPPRSTISFHTHPVRYTSRAEWPSGQDLRVAIANDTVTAWNVIVVPEGIYVLYPSAAIVHLNQHEVDKLIESYNNATHHILRSLPPLSAVQRGVAAARNLGIVLYFLPSAEWQKAVKGIPGFYEWNAVDSAEWSQGASALSKLTPKQVVKMDWTPLIRAFESHHYTVNQVASVRAEKESILPTAEGMETTPGVPFSFDLGTSPVVAAYHVVDDGFTPQELNAFAEGHRARRLVWLL
ncbi:MAG: hypothetical protein KGL39_13160, partial [Patescibacteria group bacterium]|nr:hypothetical protein [Patescibacteria group bacterium]